MKAELSREQLAYHERFHENWGQLFKTGYQDSRFAKQARRFGSLS